MSPQEEPHLRVALSFKMSLSPFQFQISRCNAYVSHVRESSDKVMKDFASYKRRLWKRRPLSDKESPCADVEKSHHSITLTAQRHPLLRHLTEIFCKPETTFVCFDFLMKATIGVHTFVMLCCSFWHIDRASPKSDQTLFSENWYSNLKSLVWVKKLQLSSFNLRLGKNFKFSPNDGTLVLTSSLMSEWKPAWFDNEPPRMGKSRNAHKN